MGEDSAEAVIRRKGKRADLLFLKKSALFLFIQYIVIFAGTACALFFSLRLIGRSAVEGLGMLMHRRPSPGYSM
ncbi:hypothetical protein SCFA_130033 [anaerobic digester metagenome]|jgi:hypothetical protein|uniref:Uncharacterized protein n=1 Tax=anaerobic digester metagenome TaxID=1263854 RepID=A0A485LVP2_9ZZZZ